MSFGSLFLVGALLKQQSPAGAAALQLDASREGVRGGLVGVQM